MFFIIQKQFTPGKDSIWVSQLDENDSVYQYELIEEAEAKLAELQATDTEGRKFQITEI